MKGKLIVLEGIDNCGKTTQVSLISNWLKSQGIDNLITKELTTPIGSLIHSYLGNALFTPILKTLLFAADRIQRLEQGVTPALNSGLIVLADRWVLSAIAYRMAEGLDRQFVLQVNSLVKDPDITILIDIDPDEAWIRGQESSKPCPYSKEFLKRVRQIYLQLASQFQIPIINGLESPQGVLAAVKHILSNNF